MHEHAHALVLRYGWNAVSYQVLNPGMQHWHAAAGDAVAGYVRFRRTRVVAGAPVCSPARLPDAVAELEADAKAHGEDVLYFGAAPRLERICAAQRGHCAVRIGSQPVWHPGTWPAQVQRSATLRAQLSRARNKDVRVSEWSSDRAAVSVELRTVLRRWLDARGLRAMSFLVTPHTGSLADRRIFVAEHEGRVVAWLAATPIPARDGWLVEQWPRLRSAPNGTTHLLVDAALRAFAHSGSRYATLGLAPLSERAQHAAGTPPLWLRSMNQWLRSGGSRFYNFRGLEAFKASLCPTEWEPVFAIGQGARFTPAMLRAIAGVFSGGAPEPFVARSLVRTALRAS